MSEKINVQPEFKTYVLGEYVKEGNYHELGIKPSEPTKDYPLSDPSKMYTLGDAEPTPADKVLETIFSSERFEKMQKKLMKWYREESQPSDLQLIKGNPQTDQYLLIKDRGEYLIVLNDYLVGKKEIVFTLGHIDSELPMQDLLHQAEHMVTLLNKEMS